MIGLGLLLAATAAGSACVPVETDRIYAKDLAAAMAEFSAVPGDTAIGYSPSPGVRRVFTAPDLLRLATRYGVQVQAAREICFELPGEPLTPERIAHAMQVSLAAEGARVTVTGFLNYPVPKGELVFPRTSLANPVGSKLESAALWRGYVRYAGNKRFPVWATATIVVPQRRVVAREDLARGKPVKPAQLELQEHEGFPAPDRYAQSIEELTGRVPRIRVPAGSPVRTDAFEAAKAVNKGDTVTVEVRSGAARLHFDARAESSGATGETIAVRNPMNGKLLKASVEGTGRASIAVAAPLETKAKSE